MHLAGMQPHKAQPNKAETWVKFDLSHIRLSVRETLYKIDESVLGLIFSTNRPVPPKASNEWEVCPQGHPPAVANRRESSKDNGQRQPIDC